MVVVNVSDDHKVTATITDGTITLAKLHVDVQTAIGKAHSHENETVLAGITADKVQAWDGAVEKEHTHTFVESELNLIKAGDVEKWNGAQAAAEATAANALSGAKAELEGKITAAETAAKGHADGLNTAMDARVTALDGKVDTGDKKVSEYVAAAIADAKTDASNKVTVALAEAQKGIAAVQGNLDTHTGNADIHVTAEAKTTWNGAVHTVTAAADKGC